MPSAHWKVWRQKVSRKYSHENSGPGLDPGPVICSNFYNKNNFMKAQDVSNAIGSNLVQIAWVVKDIKAAEKFFKEVMGVSEFGKMENFRSQDYEHTYYGERVDCISHTYQAYLGNVFVELIQPVSGRSIFHDFLKKNPEGGVQHIAFRIPVAELDKAIDDLEKKGYPVITSYNTSIAKIVFIDTYKEIGVVTEIMGVTDEGVEAIENMKK
jgi:methylmalonyl-CoA/ethylmalonyl-CoA epimerase